MVAYTIDNGKRIQVFYLIAIIAIVLTPLLNSAISYFTIKIPMLDFLDKTLYVQGFAIFGLLILLFDRYVWRIRILSGTPNLNGVWKGHYMSYQSGKELSADEIDELFRQNNGGKEVEMEIVQTWQKMDIFWEDAKSVSFAISINLVIKSFNIYQLQWMFDPKDRTSISSRDKYGFGVSTCIIKEDGQTVTLEGVFFTQKLIRGYYKLKRQSSSR